MQRESVPLLRLSRMAAGFLKPTPYGTFGSALGNAATGLADGLQDESDMKLREQGAEQQAALFAMRKQQMDQQQAAAQQEQIRQAEIAGVYDGLQQPVDPLMGMPPAEQERPTGVGVGTVLAAPEMGVPPNNPLMQNQPGQNRPTQDRLRSAQLKLMKLRAGGAAKDLGALFAKPERETVVINGRLVYKDTGEVVAEIPKQMTELQKAQLAGEEFGPNGPQVQEFQLSRARAGATNVDARNMSKAESAYDVARAKEFAAQRGAIDQAAMSAPEKLADLEQISMLLDGVQGGNLATAQLAGSSALASLGINIDPKMGDKEAAQSIALGIAASMRQAGTGVMTDKDFEVFLKRTPDLSKTDAGRRQIIQTMIAKAKRDQKVQELAVEYEGANGRLDSGFTSKVAKLYRDMPIVAKPGTVSGKIGQAKGVPGPDASDDEIAAYYRDLR